MKPREQDGAILLEVRQCRWRDPRPALRGCRRPSESTWRACYPASESSPLVKLLVYLRGLSRGRRRKDLQAAQRRDGEEESMCEVTAA